MGGVPAAKVDAIYYRVATRERKKEGDMGLVLEGMMEGTDNGFGFGAEKGKRIRSWIGRWVVLFFTLGWSASAWNSFTGDLLSTPTMSDRLKFTLYYESAKENTNPDGSESYAAMVDESDVKYVVQNTPWFTANFHLIIKQWLRHLTWEQSDFSSSCIWVHVHGLPLPQLNERNAERIGNLFEGMFEYEVEVDSILQTSGVLMIKTEFYVKKPLLTGFTNYFTNEWQPWVSFKYEDLSDLC
ncbi:hypothetical protein Tsubulata_012137 [Turnera subulata]|uniref:DUF4283 domain-containing protein n=1 Tax=Turnera subulata TaxID=218843 RepID=A0A9Q0JR21_9ROSI|nr:hypothetical protein Tsubulata_012137 [Turnera subulata]